MNKLIENYVVSGLTCDGESFSDFLSFRLIEPCEDEMFSGTGCYVIMITYSYIDSCFVSKHTRYFDVRYEGTTDICVLAYRIIKSIYSSDVEIERD